MPPLLPITSNYLWGGCCIKEVSIWPRCAWQAQPSLNDTLSACPPAGVGGEGARPGISCDFFFRCVRPQGPARLPAAGLAQGPTLTLTCPNSGHHVLPISGIQKLPARG